MLRKHLFTCLTLAALVLGSLTLAGSPALAGSSLDGKPIKGKVLETMDAGGYTYLQLETDGDKVWVAIPKTAVEKGQEVTCNPGMTMTDFQSKSLNRTFASIVFSSGLNSGDKPFNPNPHGSGGAMGGASKGMSFEEALQAEQGGGMAAPAMDGAAMMASGGSASAIVPSKEVKVDKADGGYTIGECFAKAKELDGKKVKVRGKVVKVSRMIMGKNWIHIQDGTGNPMKNTHDLVVTTMAEPAMDSIVLVEGTLHADKDFGAGYKYDVIIEDATVK